LILVSAALLPATASSAGEAKRIDLWRDADVKARGALLKRWRAEIRGARSRTPGWKPDKGLEAVLPAVAAVPTDSPELWLNAAGLFLAIGQPSDACVRFCGACLSMKVRNPRLVQREVLQLLTDVRAKSDEARAIALKTARSAGNPDLAFGYLCKAFPADEEVKRVVLKALLQDENKEAREAALSSFGSLRLNRREATSLISKMVAELKDQDSELGLTAQLVRSLPTNASVYRGLLTPKDVKDLLRIGREDPSRRMIVLSTLTHTGSKVPPREMAEFLFRTPVDSQTGDGRELLALAFMPTGVLSKDALFKKLPEFTRMRSGYGQAGLLSLLVRHTGDPRAAFDTWKKKTGKYPKPNEDYWQSVCNVRGQIPIPPEHWKKSWQEVPAEARDFVHTAVVMSLSAYPGCDHVRWLLDNALQNEKTAAAALVALHAAGPRIKKAHLDDKMVAWLKDKAGKTAEDASSALMAAGVLATVLEDRAAAHAILKSPRAVSALKHPEWSAYTNLALRTGQPEKYLSGFRASLEKISTRSTWLLWILDLGLGKKNGKVPTDSLAAELQAGSCAWLRVLRHAGPRVYPHLAELRSPTLMACNTRHSQKNLMRFLGVLDALEIEKKRN